MDNDILALQERFKRLAADTGITPFSSMYSQPSSSQPKPPVFLSPPPRSEEDQVADLLAQAESSVNLSAKHAVSLPASSATYTASPTAASTYTSGIDPHLEAKYRGLMGEKRKVTPFSHNTYRLGSDSDEDEGTKVSRLIAQISDQVDLEMRTGVEIGGFEDSDEDKTRHKEAKAAKKKTTKKKKKKVGLYYDSDDSLSDDSEDFSDDSF